MKKILLVILTTVLGLPGLAENLISKMSLLDSKHPGTTVRRDAIQHATFIEEGEESALIENEIKLRAAQATLYPMYSLPQGIYYLGVSKEQISYNDDVALAVAPAYTTEAKWINRSTGASSYEWLFPDPNGDDVDTYLDIITDKTPNVMYPPGAFYAPELTAVNGQNPISYKWGHRPSAGIAKGMVIYGTSLVRSHPTLGTMMEFDGITNIDNVTCAVGTSKISDTDYLFGSNSVKIDAIGETFSKPLSPYRLKNVRIGLSKFNAPNGHEFKLTIYKYTLDKSGKTPILGDIIATSIATTDDIYKGSLEATAISLTFEDFKVKNGDYEITQSDLIIQDSIFVTFSGYNLSGVTLAVADQMLQSLDEKATAYISMPKTQGSSDFGWYNVKDKIKEKDGNGNQIPKRTSLDITLGIDYPHFYSKETKFEASATGGTKTFAIASYYMPYFETEEGERIDVLTFDNVPDWVTPSYTFDNKNGVAIVFDVKSLPEGLTERSEIITATIEDMLSLDFTINQSIHNSSIENHKNETRVQAEVTANTFELSYSLEDFRKVSIYNLAGLLISEYTLPETGELSIQTNGFAKGVYLLKFKGLQSETIKLVR